jgi:hypothetical protein
MIFVCFWAFLAFAVRTVQLRKPGLPLFPVPLWGMSTFIEYLGYPDQLTEAGRRARKKCFVFGLGLIFFVGIYLLTGSINSN